MSHALGIVCPQCNDVLERDICPEGCERGHGYGFAPMSEWSAQTWPNHGCFRAVARGVREATTHGDNDE